MHILFYYILNSQKILVVPYCTIREVGPHIIIIIVLPVKKTLTSPGAPGLPNVGN